MPAHLPSFPSKPGRFLYIFCFGFLRYCAKMYGRSIFASLARLALAERAYRVPKAYDSLLHISAVYAATQSFTSSRQISSPDFVFISTRVKRFTTCRVLYHETSHVLSVPCALCRRVYGGGSRFCFCPSCLCGLRIFRNIVLSGSPDIYGTSSLKNKTCTSTSKPRHDVTEGVFEVRV